MDNLDELEKMIIDKLKITHYYYSFDNQESGAIISTSVEVSKEEKNTKKVTNVYYDTFDTDRIEELSLPVDDVDSLFDEINKLNISDLKNNYFTDRAPEKYTYWEIKYNDKFLIVGTYNQEVQEYKKLKELLGLDEIIKSNRN